MVVNIVKSPDHTREEEEKSQEIVQSARTCTQASDGSLFLLLLLCRGISQPNHNHGDVVVRISGFRIFYEFFHRLSRILDVSNMIDSLLVFRNIP